MLWRGIDPNGHSDALYSCASILLFAWILGAVGVYKAGVATYIMLTVATLMIGLAAVRRQT